MPRHRPHRTRRAAARARRHLEAAFWDDATQLFHSSLDLATILPRVAQLTTRILGDSCTIFLYETDSDTLVPAATYHPDPAIAQARNAWLRTTRLRRDFTSATGRAAATGQPVLIRDATTDPRIYRPVVAPLRVASYLAAPIRANGRVLGVLGTSYTLPGQAFTARDILLAMAVADRAASAIAHAQSLALERQRQQQLHTILEIHREITGELEVASLLPLLLRKALTLLGGTSALVFRYDEATQRLLPWAVDTPLTLGGTPLDMGEGVVGQAALQRQGLLVNDYQTSPLAHPRLVAHGVTAVIAQPLLSAGTLLGVLAVTRACGRRPFTTEEFALLDIFAHQATIAIMNARSYTQAQHARAAAEARAQQLAVLIAVSNAVSGALDWAAMFASVSPAVLQATQGAHLVVTLVDPVTQAEQVALVSPPGSLVLQVPAAGSADPLALGRHAPAHHGRQ